MPNQAKTPSTDTEERAEGVLCPSDDEDGPPHAIDIDAFDIAVYVLVCCVCIAVCVLAMA